MRSLTEQVRHLYENSAVTVAEIARIVGVSERTIYNYVRKRRWKRRIVRLGVDMRALDPEGARLALERSVRIGLIAEQAAAAALAAVKERAAEAQAAAETEARLRAFDMLNRTLAELARLREAPGASDADPLIRAKTCQVNVLVDQIEALQAGRKD